MTLEWLRCTRLVQCKDRNVSTRHIVVRVDLRDFLSQGTWTGSSGLCTQWRSNRRWGLGVPV